MNFTLLRLRLVSAPKGRDKVAQGNALGKSSLVVVQPGKGEIKRVVISYLAPLGLGVSFPLLTQGVALGYPISPLWGCVITMNHENYCAFARFGFEYLIPSSSFSSEQGPSAPRPVRTGSVVSLV